MYKTLLIDLDDTLWDTRRNGKESLEEVYRDYNLDRFFTSFDSFYTVYFPNNLDLWAKYRNGEIDKQELILERFRYPLKPYMDCSEDFLLSLNEDFLNRTTLKTRLLPYAVEILSYLKPTYKIYIVSNGFEEVQYKKINNSGLSAFFDGIILSDTVGVNKPHPLIFREAMKEANASEEECLMIGDSWDADIIGAKNTGIDQCWYDLGVEQPGDFRPTFLVRSLPELKEIL